MARYIVYTYQFSPIVTKQRNLFENNPQSLAEIMSQKQEIFGNIFNGELHFVGKNTEYSHRVLYNQDNIIVFRLANRKYQSLEEDFSIIKHQYSPSCLVIIDNRKNVQHIAIEEDLKAFQDTETVKNILIHTFSQYLRANRLRIEIQREFQDSEFWNLIRQYPNGMSMVRFTFSYPNLPRVSSSIDNMISEASRVTNSQQTVFELNAAPNNQLTLEKRNRKLSGLAKASADSGNIITLKAKGYRRHIQTGHTSKSLEIENLEILLQGDLIETATTKLIKELNKIK